MSTKLLLLKSGEQVIAEAKELVRKEGDYRLVDKVYGYLLTQPHKVSVNKPMVLTEDINDQSNVEITLSPWILLTNDKVMTVPKEWVITIVNPIDSIEKMYQEKING
tara:strand:+ start:188 stop:508 length:321 start_codon:yes stop_codon:yes gene_type:complete